MPLKAVLTGTYRQPELRFAFHWGATMPRGGKPAQEWVKKLGGRYFDRSEKVWYITGVGTYKNPDRFFADAGIEVDFSEAEGELAGLTSLNDLWRPIVQRSARFPHMAFVRPRLAGFEDIQERLGPGAVWDKDRKRFEVLLSDLLTPSDDGLVLKRGFNLDAESFADAVASRRQSSIPEHVRLAARELAASTGVEGDEQKELSPRTLELIDVVAAHTGRIPEWFGLALYPFQTAGAYAIVGGHNALCDAPGLGKTRQALAAAAISGADRIVIVVPPLVVTNFSREATAALGPKFAPMMPPPEPTPERKRKPSGKKKKAPEFPSYIVPIRAGRKVPPFPDSGVIVIADSLLASRPALLDDIIAWGPQCALFDEAHRASTWSGKRATADRNLSLSINGLSVPMTGTPFKANPVEITNILAMSGHLQPVFGSAGEFITRYASKNHFGAWLPKRDMLPELERSLTANCWTRRNKQDVLKQLPPKLRSTRVVDIDRRGFAQAHTDLYEKIGLWVEEMLETGQEITREEIKTYARSHIELIAPLRAAAGVAKIPAAIEIVKDWMEMTTETAADGTKTYSRPLVVWVHHNPVMEALKAAIPEDMAGIGFIDGSTPEHKRQPEADKLQNGEIGVIFCSILAAGFGITLTASSDVLFIETDWTPANVSQAEDRVHRIGQTETCMITTLLAVDTLDAHMRAILRNKGKDLNVLMPGADNNVTVMTAHLNEDAGQYEILTQEDRELEKEFKSVYDIIERITTEIVASRSMMARAA